MSFRCVGTFLGPGLDLPGDLGPEVEPTNGHKIPQSTMEVVITNKMTRFRYDTELNNRNIGKEELLAIRVGRYFERHSGK